MGTTRFTSGAWRLRIDKIPDDKERLPRGGPESPMVFTLLVDTVLALNNEWWKIGKNSASDWTNGFVPSVAYADDSGTTFFFLDFADGFREVGLEQCLAKTNWSSTHKLRDQGHKRGTPKWRGQKN